MRIAIPRETEAGEPRVAGTPDTVKRLTAPGVTAFAMELMPRITRAQAMDILSSRPTSQATRR
jgi:NAD(P) transhydrogenase subunit alpha